MPGSVQERSSSHSNDDIPNPDDPTTPPMTDTMSKLIDTTDNDLQTITDKVVMDLSATVRSTLYPSSMNHFVITASKFSLETDTRGTLSISCLTRRGHKLHRDTSEL